MLLLVLSAVASEEIKVEVDGQLLSFSVSPSRNGARVLVPLRGIFEALGADVSWKGTNQSITENKDGTEVVLIIGDNSALVNGKSLKLDVPAKIIGSSTMVPIRFVSEALGANVLWNQLEQKVEISSTSDNTQVQEIEGILDQEDKVVKEEIKAIDNTTRS